ncbi:MAG: response regulator [Burkholderiaceae bacterium]|nr:response regulator [Burkholderiaceae bacterium]
MNAGGRTEIGQKTILIVDDTPANVGLLVDYLEDHGLRVIVAQDGAEGIRRAQFARPDLILLDVMMPGLDGFETCRRLKSDLETRDIPILFMTAVAEPGEKIVGFGVGGVDYVTKPFQVEEVLARVNTHLSLRAMQLELERRNALLEKEIEGRQKVEAALRLTQFSVDNATSAVFWLNPDGSIAYVNEAACQLTLHPRAMLMTLHAYDLEVGTSAESWPGQWQYIKAHRSYTSETRLRIRDNIIVPVEGTVKYHDYGGREYAFISVRDIGERKQAEQALKNSFAELQESNRQLEEAHHQLLQAEKLASIGQLAAGVAHEINNPIAFVNSNLGTLQSYFGKLAQLLALYERAEPLLATQPALQQEIESMRQAADLDYMRADLKNLVEESLAGVQRVRSIVQYLKDFARASESERQTVDLNACLDGALNLVGAQVRLKADIRQEYGTPPPVTAVPMQLSQVFMNLLINASQAIGTFGAIVIRTGQEQEWAWVEIEDNGCGISVDDLPRIFEPFFTTKPVGVGVGLGLSLSYGIVTQHGGRFEVRSEVARGARFRVLLPARTN